MVGMRKARTDAKINSYRGVNSLSAIRISHLGRRIGTADISKRHSTLGKVESEKKA